MLYTLCIVLFVLALVLDVFWARYTIATAGRRPVHAVMWAAAIYLPVGVITPSIAHHPVYVLALAAGAACGTYIATRVRKVSE